MEENLEKLSQIVKSETNDIFQSLNEIKESKKEVKFEQIYKDKVIIEEYNDTPNLSSSLVDPNRPKCCTHLACDAPGLD